MSILCTGFAAASGGYSITNSARFNGTSDYLSRTPGSASGNAQFWISTWVKLGSTTTQQEICSAYGGGTGLYIRLLSTGELQIQNYAGTVYRKSTRLFRDPSGWGQLFLSFNGSTGIDGWWNNEALTWGTSGSLPASYDWNNNVVHRIGCPAHATSDLWKGYYADFISASGATGTPSLTGQTGANGVWEAINYSGTYGTNGFKLEFLNNGALGTDTSGNGNTWTVNGTPVQTVDTPTKNYAVFNSLTNNGGYYTLSLGNQTAAWVGSDGTANRLFGTAPFDAASTTGFYFEFKVVTMSVPGNGNWLGGIIPITTSSINGAIPADFYGSQDTGQKYGANTASSYFGAAFANGDVIGVYVKNGKLWMSKNGTIPSSGDPATEANPAFTGLTGLYTPALMCNGGGTRSNTTDIRAQEQQWLTTPPTGFLPITAANGVSTAVTTSGTFPGNADADGPVVWANGNPDTLTINGNAVTFGTHADKTAGGFKLRSSSSSYNTAGSNTWTATAGKRFVYSATSINTAQGNP